MDTLGAKIVAGLGALLFFVVMWGCFYTVDQGDRGVILRNGAVVGEAEPGLGFKMPIVDGVEDVSVQSQKQAYTDVKVYSHDQQPAVLRVSFNYHVTDARTVYMDYKSIPNMIERLVSPQVYTWSENVFGQYEAAKAVQERAKLNADLSVALHKIIRGPLLIESVQIENIDFSGKYEQAVEARMEANVKQQQAVSEAAATRTRAEAGAYAVKVQGDAQASAIRARGDALRDNPGLPDLVVAEKWNGVLPATMVPGGGVPFLNVGRK